MSRPQKRRKLVLKTLERHGQMHTRRKPGRWFYSFVPLKASAGGAAPLIPVITMSVGGGPREVGLVNAAGSTASMLGGLFWGKLSDKLNRRKVFLLAGFLGTAFSTMLFGLVRTPMDAIIINALYTFFLSATIPIPILILTKEFRLEDWNRAIGRFNEIGGWAWVGGMVIGLLLSSLTSPRETFLILGVLALISFPWGLKTIREVPLHLSRKVLGTYTSYVVEKFRYIPNMLTHLPQFPRERLGGLYVSSIMFWFGAMLYFTQFPVLLRSSGFGPTMLYLMSIANSSISAFMYTRVGRKVGENGGYGTLKKGLTLRAIAFALLALSTKLHPAFIPLAFVSYFLAGYTWAFIGISTTAIISHEANAEDRGALLGAYNMMSSLGAIAGNFMSGFIVELCGFTLNFVLASAFMLASMIPLRRDH